MTSSRCKPHSSRIPLERGKQSLPETQSSAPTASPTHRPLHYTDLLPPASLPPPSTNALSQSRNTVTESEPLAEKQLDHTSNTLDKKESDHTSNTLEKKALSRTSNKLDKKESDPTSNVPDDSQTPHPTPLTTGKLGIFPISPHQEAHLNHRTKDPAVKATSLVTPPQTTANFSKDRKDIAYSNAASGEGHKDAEVNRIISFEETRENSAEDGSLPNATQHQHSAKQTSQGHASDPSATQSHTSWHSVERWLASTDTSTASLTQSQITPNHSIKRKRSDSFEAGKALDCPLTYDLLKKHLASNAPGDQYSGVPQVPMTPDKTSQSGQTKPDENESLVSIDVMTAANLKKNPLLVEQLLAKHGMFKNSPELENPEYVGFKTKVLKVVESDRASAAKTKSIQNFNGDAEFIAKQNEATLLEHLVDMIIKHSPRVYKDCDDINEAGAKDSIFEVEGFRDQGVFRATDRAFTPGFVPVRNDGLEDSLAQALALAKSDGVTTPKPDYIWGIRENQFRPPRETVPNQKTRAILDLAGSGTGIRVPYFLWEGKKDAGLGQAENQACNAGSAVVNSNIKLLKPLRGEQKLGPDDQTYIYSATLNRSVVEFWVHWAEVVRDPDDASKTRTWFHMNHIYAQAIRGDNALVILRRICHNILEWGATLERRAEMNDWFKRLWKWEKEQAAVEVQKIKKNPPVTPNGKRRRVEDGSTPGSSTLHR